MTLEPAFPAFSLAFDAGEPRLVATRLVADLETPVSAFLKLAEGRDGRIFLLESVEGGAARGRYSMIGLDPDILWRVREGRAEINRQALVDPHAFAPCPAPPLDALRALIAESRIPAGGELPPMAAGIFGYLGYDMVREMERLAPAKADPIGVPDAVMMRPTLMLVFDAVRDELWIVTPVRPCPRREGANGLRRSRKADRRRCNPPRRIDPPSAGDGCFPSRRAAAFQHAGAALPRHGRASERIHPRRRHLPGRAVATLLGTVRAAAVSRSTARCAASTRRRSCPISISGRFQIVCSSPEILVRLRDGTLTVRPIAGTRPRGATPAEDQRLERELLADEKERAEHLMLLDLGRNDVGRVAAMGSVAVTERFAIERYSHVMHIVSQVEGRIRDGHDLIDALCAGFPAGTTSGAPKVRAMQIIDELEVDKRGIYAGCIGYFGASGEMDTCIVLRTAIVKDGTMHVQAGAGIVFDSDPAAEARECENKAKALFRAADEAVRFATQARHGS